MGAEKDIPFFPLPDVQTKSTCSQRTRKNLHYLSKVQRGICQKVVGEQVFLITMRKSE